MINKYISSIGIELECGIDLNDIKALKKDYGNDKRFAVHRDGSVNVSSKDVYEAELTFWSDNMKELRDFLKYVYQERNIETNSSCGFHIHVKMKDTKGVIMLFSNRFLSVFKNAYLRYGSNIKRPRTYRGRLTNTYSYFKDDLKSRIQQIETSYKSIRFNALNFNSYKRYGTVEFRLFPYQKTSKEAIGTIEFLAGIIEKQSNKFDYKKIITKVLENANKLSL